MQDVHEKLNPGLPCQKHFNKKKTLFTSILDLNLRKKLSRVLHLEYCFVWCWKLDTSESRSEIPGKYWNLVFKTDGEDQLDRSCGIWRNSTGCPTRYRTRHFFNNSNTNEDIATKFEQEYVRCVRNEEECVCICFKFRCNVLISGKIIKETPDSVASGTPCANRHGKKRNILKQ